ncbi:tetratricopeptide repeat protein [Halanaerobium saccharolyticum]|uniref:Tetratricopeptide repeat protein n=1 Tax=Halanaerobium saccharolyticum TaxID=43595 RepID=A0A4R6LFM5_9FIRM|nr:tetratricopeptide repeat protein [Halanaerobium saccharolyticum]TDO78370.1 tetratricopeptide repeat protein [Halanaerobium saccharolyticum]
MFKKIIYLIIIIFLLFSVSNFALAQEAKAVEEKTSAEIFSEALNDYNSENFALAQEKFNQLLETENLDEGLQFSVLYYSTMTAVNRYQTTKAIDSLERMNDLGFQSGNLNWQIAELFLNEKNQFDSANFEEALKYLEKAKSLGLNKLDFKRDLAYAYLENQELEKAENLYLEIIKNEASAADYLNLAKIKEKQGKLKQAVEYYESALELNGTQSSLYLNLGNLYQRLNNYNSAVSIFNQGIKTRKDFAPYYIGLGESYIELENYEKAQTALKKAVGINKNSYYGYYLLGNVEKIKGNLNQALNYYSQALKYNPDYVEAYLAEGKVHLEREEYYRAISRFSLAVDKNPNYAESRYYLGKAYYQADMLEAARAELRKALHINDRYQQARELLDRIEKELNIN